MAEATLEPEVKPEVKETLSIPREVHHAIKVFHGGKRYGGFASQAAAEEFIEKRKLKGAKIKLVETDADGRPLDEIGKPKPVKMPPKPAPPKKREYGPDTPVYLINQFVKALRGTKNAKLLQLIHGGVAQNELIPGIHSMNQRKLTITLVYEE